VPDLTERTFSLEPLVHCDHQGCDTPGPPIYLDALDENGRTAYAAELEALFPLLEMLRGQVATPEKLQTIARCSQNAIADARVAARTTV
jgi:hypothetical protein